MPNYSDAEIKREVRAQLDDKYAEEFLAGPTEMRTERTLGDFKAGALPDGEELSLLGCGCQSRPQFPGQGNPGSLPSPDLGVSQWIVGPESAGADLIAAVLDIGTSKPRDLQSILGVNLREFNLWFRMLTPQEGLCLKSIAIEVAELGNPYINQSMAAAWGVGSEGSMPVPALARIPGIMKLAIPLSESRRKTGNWSVSPEVMLLLGQLTAVIEDSDTETSDIEDVIATRVARLNALLAGNPECFAQLRRGDFASLLPSTALDWGNGGAGVTTRMVSAPPGLVFFATLWASLLSILEICFVPKHVLTMVICVVVILVVFLMMVALFDWVKKYLGYAKRAVSGEDGTITWNLEDIWCDAKCKVTANSDIRVVVHVKVTVYKGDTVLATFDIKLEYAQRPSGIDLSGSIGADAGGTSFPSQTLPSDFISNILGELLYSSLMGAFNPDALIVKCEDDTLADAVKDAICGSLLGEALELTGAGSRRR